MSDLVDRVIAIAGATGSLGPWVARELASRGARLAITDRDADKCSALGEELGGDHDVQVVDLLDEAQTRAWADRVAERYGRLDGVAHLVGGWRGGTPIGEAPLEDWAVLHDLLIRTVQHTSRAFLPALKASGRGRFVLVSAKQAQQPTSTNAAYGAAKAAAEAWTLALADELGASGGAANILVVNAIVTPEMRAANPEKAYKTFADARHMADAVAFLMGDSATAMNGQRLALHS